MNRDDGVVPLAVSSVDVALYQLLETELARADVYRTALRCTATDPRSAMFEAPLEEAELHVAIAESLLDAFGLDPAADVPARLPVRTLGASLVRAMEQSVALLDEASSWATAAECVAAVLTQTERRWAFVERLAQLTQGEAGDALRSASRELAAPVYEKPAPWSAPRPQKPSVVRDFVLRPGASGRTPPVHPNLVHRDSGGSRRGSRPS